jgi:outer membrane biosynthesis protein TonB
MWGCPKRQTTRRLIYVPQPPPAATAPEQGEGSLVIQEPPPPPPEIVEEAPTEEVPAEKPVRRRPRPARAGVPTPAEVGSELDEAPPAEVPALEPRESPAQEVALRQRLAGLQGRLEQRITALDRSSLDAGARKILDDARTFLTQSQRALADGDLQRALNLAHKASLLVSALER